MIPAAPVRRNPLLVQSWSWVLAVLGFLLPRCRQDAPSRQAEMLVGHQGNPNTVMQQSWGCLACNSLCASNLLSMGVGTERVQQSNGFLFKRNYFLLDEVQIQPQIPISLQKRRKEMQNMLPTPQVYQPCS